MRRAVEIRAKRGSNSALHYSGSTKNGVTNPFCRSSKRERFDFTKSAICRRFCKVRLRKHFPEMFSPLRMTRVCCLHFEVFGIDTEYLILQYYSISPLSVPASLRELCVADTFSPGEGLVQWLCFTKRMRIARHY